MSCNCYVTRLDEIVRFTLRLGAHERDCMIYRPSLDPVDHQQDIEFRETYRRKTTSPKEPKAVPYYDYYKQAWIKHRDIDTFDELHDTYGLDNMPARYDTLDF